MCRRSVRGGRARGLTGWLVDSEGPLPEPRLEQQLAVNLADRLPGVAVRVLGVRGLCVLGWLAALPFRLVGRLVGIGPMRSGGSA